MTTGTVQITDTATPMLEATARQIRRPRALMAAVGKRVEKEYRAHFLKKNSQGNEKGWPRSNFWNRKVRQATVFEGATDTEATVNISSPELLHKITGGRVTPKRGKFLALPLTARAKAAGSPREGGWKGNSLTLRPTSKRGQFLLVEAVATSLSRSRGRITGGRETGGEAQYLLVRSVTHKPDRTALPERIDIVRAIDDQTRQFFTRQTP